MKELKSFLTNQQLKLIHEKINYLSNLEQIWNKVIPTEYVSYTRVANFNDGRLTIIVPHSGWATRIRFEMTDLLLKLQQHPEFKYLETIVCKISGEFARIEHSLESNLLKRQLSANAIESITKTAESLKEKRLKNALLKLAGKVRTSHSREDGNDHN